ncbi:MAG: hypothetical protein MZW92_78415 [Comamonadaceae bacterium]|nr:hypothetical protein [Comamonadaceae bacterium]
MSQIPNLDGDLPGLLGSPDLSVWVAVLLIQSVPYAAAVIVSIINAFALPGHWIGECRAEPAGETNPAWSAPLRRLLRMGRERGWSAAGPAQARAGSPVASRNTRHRRAAPQSSVPPAMDRHEP